MIVGGAMFVGAGAACAGMASDHKLASVANRTAPRAGSGRPGRRCTRTGDMASAALLVLFKFVPYRDLKDNRSVAAPRAHPAVSSLTWRRTLRALHG